ncbi:M15 family metallopeptidase [Roseiarcaceae bacterium H3SJ34-1]|uniref:M15 family metallopeptidase n=1 Tax=Terripilifer ovatus TaxID=3032367 RepID=UPI003AB9A6DE|nr:M15 family metallopeptidase [Roseiarcaceae bacterium H3SJ34-1]
MAHGAPRNKISAISSAACADMVRRHVLSSSPAVGCERLAIVRVSYVDFTGTAREGHICVLDVLAEPVSNIFAELFRQRFPIESVRLMNEFNGDDDASIAQNNTSGFNDRNVAGTASASTHAYGAAIDLNPVQNPAFEIVNGQRMVSPPSGRAFLDRTRAVPGMAERIRPIFRRFGFTEWGGVWRLNDYQHFQVPRRIVNQLTAVSREDGERIFSRFLATIRYDR